MSQLNLTTLATLDGSVTVNVSDLATSVGYTSENAVVSSVSELLALDWSTVEFATTKGYYSTGSGGAASYYRDDTDTTSASNGGTILLSTDGHRLKIVHFGCTDLYQWGAVGDATTDDTVAVQNAVSWADDGFKIIVPSWMGARLTSPVTSSGSPCIQGEHIVINKTVGTNVNATGAGAWFFLDHTGIGFSFNSGGTVVTRPKLSMIGTYRAQTTPGTTSWTPGSFDYDILFYNCDSVVRDIVLWNATKGIHINADSAASQSRGDISGVYGAPVVGITVDFIADVLRLDNLHFWSYYWTSNTYVQSYYLTGAVALEFYRCDNPMVTRLFTYGYAKSIYIGSNSYGTTSKLKLSTFDCDAFGLNAIYIDASSASMQIDGGGGQGYSATSSVNYLEFSSSSSGCNVSISNVDAGLCAKNALRVGGTSNNVLRVGAGVRLYNWNGGGAGFPAIGCTASNYVVLEVLPYFTAALNSGTNLDTTGSISGSVNLGTANYTTSSTGIVSVDAGMGRSPTAIFATPTSTTPYIVQRASAGSVGVYSASGTALASSTVTLSVMATFS